MPIDSTPKLVIQPPPPIVISSPDTLKSLSDEAKATLDKTYQAMMAYENALH